MSDPHCVRGEWYGELPYLRGLSTAFLEFHDAETSRHVTCQSYQRPSAGADNKIEDAPTYFEQ